MLRCVSASQSTILFSLFFLLPPLNKFFFYFFFSFSPSLSLVSSFSSSSSLRRFLCLILNWYKRIAHDTHAYTQHLLLLPSTRYAQNLWEKTLCVCIAFFGSFLSLVNNDVIKCQLKRGISIKPNTRRIRKTERNETKRVLHINFNATAWTTFSLSVFLFYFLLTQTPTPKKRKKKNVKNNIKKRMKWERRQRRDWNCRRNNNTIRIYSTL